MNGETEEKKKKKKTVRSAKECTLVAVFVALLIAAQLVLSAVPGVEVITVLFAAFAFSFGAYRGLAAATAFSLLRQLVFGFFPTVLVLYLVYYNAFALIFAFLGKKIRFPVKGLVLIVAVACVCTVLFTLLDCVITPLFYGFSKTAAKAYFYAAMPVVLPQLVCVGVSTALLFLPLWRAFLLVKRMLTAIGGIK